VPDGLGNDSLAGVTILVDDAVWPWRGERWAHLVSDHSIAELHDFSRVLRIRRLSFAGDHYDVTATSRHRALELGAEPTGAREIVRRLRDAGLRRRDVGRWQLRAEVPVEDLSNGLAPLLGPVALEQALVLAGQLQVAEPTSAARIVTRGEEVVAALTTRHETEERVGDGFELRVTPQDDLWFTEFAAERARGAPIA
jgi:hypothetical protein